MAKKDSKKKTTTQKKSAAKGKQTAKKAASKKTVTAKKSTNKKAAARKSATKKAGAKKSTSRKTATKKTTAKKKTAKKATTRKKPATKAAGKKTNSRKSSTAASRTATKKRGTEGTAPQDAPERESDFMEVESSKFRVTQPHTYEGPPMVKLERDLPEFYDDTRLVLLPRDPEWVFAFWEISLSIRNALGIPRFAHQKRMVLRIYDITGVEDFTGLNANSYFDIDINDHASSWYIRTSPKRNLCADLGLVNEEGEFVQIVRSNPVETPTDQVSDIEDEEWVIPEEQYEKILGLSEEMLSNLLKNEETSRQMKPPHLRGELPVGPGASENFPGASEQFMSGGSNVRYAPPRHEGPHDLRVNTEVVLYGSADPNADVKVQGQKVKIEPDGSFSLRVQLPEGQHEIPIETRDAKGNRQEQVISLVRRSEN